MKINNFFSVAALMMTLTVSVSAAPIVIPRDAVIAVTMDKTMSSATARAGRLFYVHQDGVNGEGFPDNTRFTGRVVSVTRATGSTPGQIGVHFLGAKLPNGTKVPINGRLTSLDSESTKTNSDTGRIMGKTSGGNKDLKFVAIGAGAGALIGQFTKKKPLVGGLIGAAAGYIYGRTQTKAAVGKNVQVAAGTRFGIVLDQKVTVPGSYSASMSNSDASQQVAFDDLRPIMSGNSLMVPFRSTMDSLNMPFTYNSSTNRIQMKSTDQQVNYNVGSRYVYVDGQANRMETASRMINGSLYVPASYIELLTNKTAAWDKNSRVLSLI